MTEQQPEEQQQELFQAVDGHLTTVSLDEVEETENGTAALKSSIETLGAASSVVLRHTPKASDHTYEIVDGRRRVATLREQGKDEVAAYVVDERFDAEADALTAAMNIVRDPNPLQEAEAIARLIEERGYTPDALSRIGIPKQTVGKRLRLWHAPEAIKEGVRDGDVAVGVAEKVANLSDVLQRECAEHYQEEGQLRHRDVKEIRQADVEERVADAAEQTGAFDTPDVSREVPSDRREEDTTETVPVESSRETFQDYIKLAGIVRDYQMNGGTDDPHELARTVIDVGVDLGYAPEKALALIQAPPAHWLPDGTVEAVRDSVS